MNTETLQIHSYSAGLFDGEGSVCLVKNKSGIRHPVASVTSTTIELLNFLKDNYGGLIVYHSKKKRKKHHADSWSWKLSSDKAIDFFMKIRPYMVEIEKIRRVDIILCKYKQLTRRNGMYSQEEINSLNDLYIDFFRNSRCKKLSILNIKAKPRLIN